MINPQVLTFDNLRGINTKKSKTQRSSNEADIALNGFFDTVGSFIKRRGFRRVNTTEITDSLTTSIDINSMYQFKTDLLIAGGSDLIAYDLNTDTYSSIKTTLTGNFFDFEQFIPRETEYCIMVNGLDDALKYDGTTLTNLSITRPATSPTVTPASGGSLTPSSSYYVAVTFIRDNGNGEIQESNPCDEVFISSASMSTNNRLSLTSVPVSTDPQVTGRRIYVSRPNGAPMFFQGTISDNTTTSYNIDTNVDVLEDKELEFDNDPAPKCYFIEKNKTRLIMAGDPDFPGRVYWSKFNEIWSFPQGQLDETVINYFDVGSTVTSIKQYYDQTFVFTDVGKIFVLQGTDQLLLSEVNNDERVTCVSDRSAIVQDNWCYFLNNDGYYRTNGQIIQKMSEPISAFFDPDNQEDATYNVHGFSYGVNQIVPVAIYYKQLNVILLWITGAGQTVLKNNVCFVMHLSNIQVEGDTIYPNFSIYTGNATRCVGTNFQDNNYKYFLCSQENGFVFRAETGRYDGAIVNSTATSATSTTLIDTTQTWVVNTYSELWVLIRSGTGAGQLRKIDTNTADTLTVSTAWSITPDATSEYSVGAINYQYAHSFNHYGHPTNSKRLIYIRPRLQTQGDSTVKVSFAYDFINIASNDLDEKIITLNGDSLWDVAQWDNAVWDGPVIYDQKLPGTASRIHRWSTVKIVADLADQSVAYDGIDKIYQLKGIR